MSTPGQPPPGSGEQAPPADEPPPDPQPLDPQPLDLQERTDPVPRRSRGRTALASLLAVLGLAAVLGGGTGLTLELTREPTAAEKKEAGEKQQALRWRLLPPGEIFPPTVKYGTGTSGKVVQGQESPQTARRVGIVPEAACSEAFDRPLAEVLTDQGCRTALRATYVDDSGTQVATIAVAVMPSTARAQKADSAFSDRIGFQARREMGVRAHGFAGTAAEGFDDAARQIFSTDVSASPYLYFRTAGWADGRAKVAEGDISDEFLFSRVVMAHVMGRFAQSSDPCDQVGVEC